MRSSPRPDSGAAPLAIHSAGHDGGDAERDGVSGRPARDQAVAESRDRGRSDRPTVAVRLLVPAPGGSDSPAPRPQIADSSLDATLALVDTLVTTLELRHPFSREGSTLLPLVADAIARELGLCDEDRRRVALAALLRDLGRTGSGEDLDRPGTRLTPEDRRRLEAHVDVGLALLEGAHLLPGVLAVVRHHRERWDGRGQPDGLSGEEIPPLARILAVADAFVGLIQPRAHRPPRRAPEALDEVAREAGERFDPVVVSAARRALVEPRPGRLGFSLRQHVMVVHGRSSVGTALAARLCAHGYVAEHAASMPGAARQLEHLPVEAVLVGSGGAFPAARELIEALRADPRLEAMPVVAFDARSAEERVALLEAGADAALPDGASFDELRGTLAAVLARWDAKGAGPARGVRQKTEPRCGLEGELTDFPLPWLLQSLHYDGRDGSVRLLAADGREGLVRVEKGEPWHARAGDLLGQDALRELLGWKAGRFRVEPSAGPGPRTIETPLMHVLLEAAVMEDEVIAFGGGLQ